LGVKRASAIWLMSLAQIGHLSPVSLLVALFFDQDYFGIIDVLIVTIISKIELLTVNEAHTALLIPSYSNTCFIIRFTPVDASILSFELHLLFELDLTWSWIRGIIVHAVANFPVEFGTFNLKPFI
jgi:hypothetical protein